MGFKGRERGISVRGISWVLSSPTTFGFGFCFSSLVCSFVDSTKFFFFFLMFVSFVCVWICSYVEVCSVAMSANWRVFCVRGQHFLYDWGLLDVVLRVCRCETRLPWGTRAATWQFFFWINFFGWSKFWITWLFIYFLCLVKQVSITNILSRRFYELS